MVKISDEISRSLSEYVLLPMKTSSGIDLKDVSLEGRLAAEFGANLPFLSAAMQSVTGPELAIKLALLGGLGVLPCSLPIEEQVKYVKEVKRFKAGFVYAPITITPDESIRKVLEKRELYGYSTFPVIENGKVVGLITRKRIHPEHHLDKTARERMVPLNQLVTAKYGISLDEANNIMFDGGVGALPILNSDGGLNSMVFAADYWLSKDYPNQSVNKEDKRLRVGAAISTHEHDRDRAKALIEAGVDFLVLDASWGHSDYQQSTLEAVNNIKNELKSDVPVIGGNVVTKEGFRFLAEAGFDGVKVGQGVGNACITLQVKGTGRGQATVVYECAKARDEFFAEKHKYVPICSDGSIRSPRDITIALALGADTVMMGSYFAQFIEAAGKTVTKEMLVTIGGIQVPVLVSLNEYWGEASERAMHYKRYSHEKSDSFVPEGESGYVVNRGVLEQGVEETTNILKQNIKNYGCRSISEFYEKAVLELTSAAARLEEGVRIIRM